METLQSGSGPMNGRSDTNTYMLNRLSSLKINAIQFRNNSFSHFVSKNREIRIYIIFIFSLFFMGMGRSP
jgi:hypothetical protein